MSSDFQFCPTALAKSEIKNYCLLNTRKGAEKESNKFEFRFVFAYLAYFAVKFSGFLKKYLNCVILPEP